MPHAPHLQQPGAARTRAAAGRAVPHEVRIVGGRWKRTPLPVADVPGLRPTPVRVRETLFNWLGQDLSGWHCVDLYAGSGALGLEAASRGAERVWLYDSSRAAVANIAKTITRLNAGESCVLQQRDAILALQHHADASIDAVFVDPPFDPAAAAAAAPQLRAAAGARRVLRPGGMLYVEAPSEAVLDAVAGLGLAPYRRARAAAVWFALFRQPPAEPGVSTPPAR